MKWNSFRVRLTLWNMAVLALVLGGFGLAFCFSIQNRMSRGFDQELAERARRAQGFIHRVLREGPPPGPGPRFAGMPPPPSDARIDRPRRGPDRFPVPGPSGPGPTRPPIPTTQRGWPRDPEAERRASFQMPRIFDRKGNPWGGPHPNQAWDPHPLPEALAGRGQYSIVTVAGDRVRLLTAPLYDTEGRIWGAVQAARDLSDLDQLWRGQVRTLLALLPLSLLVAGIGGLFLTGGSRFGRLTRAPARSPGDPGGGADRGGRSLPPSESQRAG